VLFEQAIRWSYEHGYRAFVEVSLQSVLNESIQESLQESGPQQGRGIPTAVLH
jgi:polyketide synthase 12